MSTMHKHSALLFPVVIMFICEILTAPAAVIYLALGRLDSALAVGSTGKA